MFPTFLLPDQIFSHSATVAWLCTGRLSATTDLVWELINLSLSLKIPPFFSLINKGLVRLHQWPWKCEGAAGRLLSKASFHFRKIQKEETISFSKHQEPIPTLSFSPQEDGIIPSWRTRIERETSETQYSMGWLFNSSTEPGLWMTHSSVCVSLRFGSQTNFPGFYPKACAAGAVLRQTEEASCQTVRRCSSDYLERKINRGAWIYLITTEYIYFFVFYVEKTKVLSTWEFTLNFTYYFQVCHVHDASYTYHLFQVKSAPPVFRIYMCFQLKVGVERTSNSKQDRLELEPTSHLEDSWPCICYFCQHQFPHLWKGEKCT